ncbi:MAG: FecR domain-containing protein [Minicystis sp.]
MKNLGDYLETPADAARLARQWGRVAERIERPRSVVPRLALAFGAAVALAGPVWWWSHREAPVVTAASTMRFEDGSVATLSAGTRVDVEQDTRAAVAVKVIEGRGDFVVTHDTARPFVVRSGAVEVRVVGTQFSVEHRADDAVTVRVKEGVVEVRAPAWREAKRLRAGEEVTAAPVAAAVTSAVPAAPSSEPTAAPGEPAAVPSGEPSAVPAPRNAVPAGANATSGDASLSPAEAAKQLFERATEARRSGDARGAAALYQELLNRYPRDGHAGIAAFDLARLRMDVLGDTAGAVPLLERAAAQGGGFREDALARLVRAYQASGSIKACQRAREAYLKSYPRGVHAAAVSASCP